ncbi:MAG: tetratricopeptide repeat protein [bacterium]|nr:tetratricopeptide repeat protein [bacterium]
MSKKSKKLSTTQIPKTQTAWYKYLNPLDTTNPNYSYISLILIAAITIITSFNTLWGEFVYDDNMTILEDKRIQDPHQIFCWTPRHIRTITYIIDYYFWGLNPFGFHLTNLILHTACCLLLYYLVNLILKKPQIALFTSLLFATHPIHSEAVSVISHRKDLLAMFFYCLAFIFYLQGITATFLKKVLLLAASAISYFLAMFSKEVAAVCLPVMIFMYHFLFEPSKVISIIRKYWLYFLSGFILIALFFIKLNVFGRAASPQNILMVTGNATTEYLPVFYTMLKSFLIYLRLLLFPCNLFMNYEVPISMNLFETGVIAGGLIIISIILFWLKTYRRLPGVSFATIWFLIGWLPTSNILPLVQFFVAERFMYIPSVGFCLISAIGLDQLLQKKKNMAIILLVIIIALYIPLSIKRNADWNNMYSLRFDWCQKVLAKDPNSVDAHFRLGVIYSTKKEHQEAITEFKKVIEIAPNHVEAANCLAIEYQDTNQCEPAMDIYKKLLDIVPYPAKIHSNMGILYEKQGLYEQAMAEYKLSIAIDPTLPTSYNNLGLIYEKQKQYDLALTNYQKAIAADKSYSKGYENLARIYANLGKIDNALSYAKKAVQISPSAINHANLACLYYKNGQLRQAEKEIKTAIGLEPSNKAYPLVLKKIQQL